MAVWIVIGVINRIGETEIVGVFEREVAAQTCSAANGNDSYWYTYIEKTRFYTDDEVREAFV